MFRNLKTVNPNKTGKVYLVIITSNDLTRFHFLTLKNNFDVHAQKCSKEKTL